MFCFLYFHVTWQVLQTSERMWRAPTFRVILRVNLPNAEAVVCEEASLHLGGNGFPRQGDRTLCFTGRTEIQRLLVWS